MKILVLCGSPHKNGTTNALAEAFFDGIDTEKHSVEKIWCRERKLLPVWAVCTVNPTKGTVR